ncbi:hypothetical protein T09_7060 [Trichinella sp. T9]|nr:hypothetical protein T09_7060 [Trichinella sp. T9]
MCAKKFKIKSTALKRFGLSDFVIQNATTKPSELYFSFIKLLYEHIRVILLISVTGIQIDIG